MSGIKVAVDALRVRSGGGVAHLIGILDIDNIAVYGISEIHLWSYQGLLDKVPNRPWLIKHQPAEADGSLIKQIIWQATQLAKEIAETGCQILFSADATTFCRFSPMVVLSQNMLPYEEGVMSLYGFSKDRLRQRFVYEVQKRAFRRAQASIFLTRHAATQIQKYIGKLTDVTCIAHGVSEIFKQTNPVSAWPYHNERPIHCLYVSPVLEYKFQWTVVKAIKQLRDEGVNIGVTFAGGGGTRAMTILAEQIRVSDPTGEFVEILEFLAHDQIPKLISESDLFIFASGCETFGISLLEAMAVGIPIACSNKSSLPETLRDAGEYFDPADPAAIADAVKNLIDNPRRRDQLANAAKALAQTYSWQRCANETWAYVVETYRRISTEKQI